MLIDKLKFVGLEPLRSYASYQAAPSKNLLHGECR
jgi:hypothetical protein